MKVHYFKSQADFRRWLEKNAAKTKEVWIGFFKRARERLELNKANVYSITYRLQNAKRPETRARWIERIVAMLAEGKKFH